MIGEGIFKYYKIFYRKLFKILFYVIRQTILFINAKDIVEILNSADWKNARSVFYFYTNILVNEEELKQKNYPVKFFKLKWYIWLMYYVWAAWVITKILIYLTIYHAIRFVIYDFWKITWLVLLEYWRLRLDVFFWTLYIIFIVFFIYNLVYKLIRLLYKNRWLISYAIMKFFRVYYLYKIIFSIFLKYFRVRDKFGKSLWVY